MFDEDDLLPLAALQHITFCERQCALMYVEGQWTENRLTVEGRQLHDSVHERGSEMRGGVRIARGLRLRSLRLGLVGVADVVEFHPVEPQSPQSPQSAIRDPQSAIFLPGLLGLWRPFPVEYKRGKPKPELCDEVQLCGQAICLEEMLDVRIAEGALFYGRTRRRHSVAFDERLRRVTEETAARLHELIASGRTPPPKPARHCRNCSVVDLCLPNMARRRSVERYLRAALRHEKEIEP